MIPTILLNIPGFSFSIHPLAWALGALGLSFFFNVRGFRRERLGSHAITTGEQPAAIRHFRYMGWHKSLADLFGLIGIGLILLGR